MISVTILTKNSEETLRATLQSTLSFPEVILYDTGSTDDTLAIAKSFPHVKIFSGALEGFGPTHNKVSALASYDWILSLDSDEILSPALIEELHALPLDSNKTYSIQRHNFFWGKQIKGCAGWHPDVVVRLYNREVTQFTSAEVHEQVETKGLLVIALKNGILHTPYRTISDFLHKMHTYSDLFAKQNKKKTSLSEALFRSWFAFFKSYFLKRGFLAGNEGLLISLYNAHTTFYKYAKLYENQKK